MFQDYLKSIYSFFFDTIQTILIAASVFLVIYIFLMRPFEVSGDSMFPTFKNGEYILTNLISLRFGDPVKGDVIVFKSPNDEKKDFIKRVMATPGDTISVENSKVYVNGELLDESEYLSETVRTPNGQFLQEGRTVTVPEGNFFVMGDNRPHSSDSREWGFLPKEEVIGKSFFVYWPPQNMRVITNPFDN
jgi:signal peptidase I